MVNKFLKKNRFIYLIITLINVLFLSYTLLGCSLNNGNFDSVKDNPISAFRNLDEPVMVSRGTEVDYRSEFKYVCKNDYFYIYRTSYLTIFLFRDLESEEIHLNSESLNLYEPGTRLEINRTDIKISDSPSLYKYPMMSYDYFISTAKSSGVLASIDNILSIAAFVNEENAKDILNFLIEFNGKEGVGSYQIKFAYDLEYTRFIFENSLVFVLPIYFIVFFVSLKYLRSLNDSDFVNLFILGKNKKYIYKDYYFSNLIMFIASFLISMILSSVIGLIINSLTFFSYPLFFVDIFTYIMTSVLFISSLIMILVDYLTIRRTKYIDLIKENT